MQEHVTQLLSGHAVCIPRFGKVGTNRTISHPLLAPILRHDLPPLGLDTDINHAEPGHYTSHFCGAAVNKSRDARRPYSNDISWAGGNSLGSKRSLAFDKHSALCLQHHTWVGIFWHKYYAIHQTSDSSVFFWTGKCRSARHRVLQHCQSLNY